MKILATRSACVVRILETIEDDQPLYDFIEYMDSSVLHDYPYTDIEVPLKELTQVTNFLDAQGWSYRVY